jgi:hypothetical protein
MTSEKISRESADTVMQWIRKRSKNVENRKMSLMFQYILQEIDAINEANKPRPVGRPVKRLDEKVDVK